MKTTEKQSERDFQRLFPWFRDDLAHRFRKSTDTYSLDYEITILYYRKAGQGELKELKSEEYLSFN